MTATGTEARVCQDIADRQQVGLSKYGTSVEANPLGLLEWYKHHYTELLDAAVYVKRIIELMEGVQGRQEEADECGAAEIARFQSTTLEDGSTLTASGPVDPHAELRKTWKPGQRWQQSGPDGVWHNCNNQPLWAGWMKYRRHPDDKDPQAPAEDVSKPVEGPWIDWWGSKEWPRTHALVQVRLRDGTIDTHRPDHYYWNHRGTPGDIVAYKVVK